MTINEYHRLGQAVYEFQLYYGLKLYGYIAEVNQRYYVVMPNQNNQDKSAADIGTPVKLEQIEKYRIVNREELMGSRIDQGSWIALPSSQFKATKMVILGAGASFDYTYQGGILVIDLLYLRIFLVINMHLS